MANYCYECPRCHRNVDILKPMSDMDRAETCGACGKDMERILQPIAGAYVVGGGTGAGRGAAARRAQAKSDTIRSMNPTDKANVQRENVYRESGLEMNDAAVKRAAQEMTG